MGTHSYSKLGRAFIIFTMTIVFILAAYLFPPIYQMYAKLDSPSSAAKRRLSTSLICPHLFGKVQIVTSFHDYTVQVVDSYPDLKVRNCNNYPTCESEYRNLDSAGLWQIVDSYPDFKVKIVDYAADIKIQWVTSFPGCM